MAKNSLPVAGIYFFMDEAYKTHNRMPSPGGTWSAAVEAQRAYFQSGPSENGFHLKSPNSWSFRKLVSGREKKVWCGLWETKLPIPLWWYIINTVHFYSHSRLFISTKLLSRNWGATVKHFRNGLFVCLIDFNSLKNGVFYLFGHRRSTGWGKHFFH